MTKRFVPLLFVLAACSSGSSDDEPSSFSASFTGNEAAPDEDDDEDDESTTDDDPTSMGKDEGDGDPTSMGNDDEDEAGDGDGDDDPCLLICDGKAAGTPTSCEAPYIIGRTAAKAGFFFGGSTQASMNSDHERCGPHENPDNWDSGYDHFFRIYLVAGDTITAVQKPNGWDARLKIHDEATCIGSAKVCSSESDPAEIIGYKAPKTDWFTIVADGRSLAYQDWGDYTLTVELAQGPNVDECGCP